MVNSGICY